MWLVLAGAGWKKECISWSWNRSGSTVVLVLPVPVPSLLTPHSSSLLSSHPEGIVSVMYCSHGTRYSILDTLLSVVCRPHPPSHSNSKPNPAGIYVRKSNRSNMTFWSNRSTCIRYNIVWCRWKIWVWYLNAVYNGSMKPSHEPGTTIRIYNLE